MLYDSYQGWMESASCRTTPNPDIFFADFSDARGRLDIREAKQVCGSCPVRLECLEYAVTRRIPHGIFGSLDWEQRKILIRLRDDVAAATA